MSYYRRLLSLRPGFLFTSYQESLLSLGKHFPLGSCILRVQVDMEKHFSFALLCTRLSSSNPSALRKCFCFVCPLLEMHDSLIAVDMGVLVEVFCLSPLVKVALYNVSVSSLSVFVLRGDMYISILCPTSGGCVDCQQYQAGSEVAEEVGKPASWPWRDTVRLVSLASLRSLQGPGN